VLRGTYKIEVNVFSRSRYPTGAIDAVLVIRAGGCLRLFNADDLSGRSTIFELSYGGVDAPGTTGLLSRMALARQAATKVLDTLTDADYAGLVAFDGCTLSYSNTLVRVTDDAREQMKHWVANLMPGTSTNYVGAFEATFQVLRDTVSSGVALCPNSTLIMFLTDGRPDTWTDGNLARVRELNTADINAAMLTYTLGDDIDATITNQLACENEGIYHHISQAAGLDGAMASYYKYFATTYRGCEEDALRWVEFDDAITCTRLLAGCMPIFDGNTLFGVTCMDASVIASLDELQATPGWSAFHDEYVADSRKCAYHPRPDLVSLRAAAGDSNRIGGVDVTCAAASTASVSTPTSGELCTKVNPMSPFRTFVCEAVGSSPSGGGEGGGDERGDETVTVSFHLNGNVESYDTLQRAAIERAIADGAGVAMSAVAARVEAASVRVTALITVAGGTASATVTILRNGILATGTPEVFEGSPGGDDGSVEIPQGIFVLPVLLFCAFFGYKKIKQKQARQKQEAAAMNQANATGRGSATVAQMPQAQAVAIPMQPGGVPMQPMGGMAYPQQPYPQQPYPCGGGVPCGGCVQTTTTTTTVQAQPMVCAQAMAYQAQPMGYPAQPMACAQAVPMGQPM